MYQRTELMGGHRSEATQAACPLDRFVSWWRLKQARKAAKRYGLDFEHQCCFREQVAHIGRGLKYGNGEIVLVPMRSGKIARYKVTSERYSYFDDTGQKNWKFEFQGYEPTNAKLSGRKEE